MPQEKLVEIELSPTKRNEHESQFSDDEIDKLNLYTNTSDSKEASSDEETVQLLRNKKTSFQKKGNSSKDKMFASKFR